MSQFSRTVSLLINPNRYARTVVSAIMKNPNSVASEVVFTMVIPSTAFISNFTMTLKNGQVGFLPIHVTDDARAALIGFGYQAYFAHGPFKKVVILPKGRNSFCTSDKVLFIEGHREHSSR